MIFKKVEYLPNQYDAYPVEYVDSESWSKQSGKSNISFIHSMCVLLETIKMRIINAPDQSQDK